jgi:PhnB protein
MSLTVSVHLNFKGNARQALMFYQSVFSGQLSIVTYSDGHDSQAADKPDHVMWGQVLADSGFRIMAYDVQTAKSWHPGDNAIYVVIEGATEDGIAGYWSNLNVDAEIIQPLRPSTWSPLSGMLKDQFGVVWVLSVVNDRQNS